MSSIKTPIKRGARSVDVGRVQTVLVKLKLLKDKLPNGRSSVDCDFGSATEEAVKAFQRQSDLTDTGVVDFTTLRALIPFRTVTVTGMVSGEPRLRMPRMRLLPTTPLRPPTLTPPLDLNLHQRDPPSSTGGFPFPYPLPAAPPAPTDNKGAGIVYQPQVGPQFLLRPLWYTMPPGSTRPGLSLTAPFQFWVTYRTKKDGLHLEVAMGPSLSVNHKFQTDDPRFTISGNVSITVADIFVRGSFHLLSPQIQFGGYNNTDDSMRTISSGFSANIGNQMSYEIIDDKLMLMLTPGFWLQYDLKTTQTQIAPGAALTLGGSF